MKKTGMGTKAGESRVDIENERDGWLIDWEEERVDHLYQRYLKMQEFSKRLNDPSIQESLTADMMLRVWCMKNGWTVLTCSSRMHIFFRLGYFPKSLIKLPDFVMWEKGNPRFRDGIFVETKQINYDKIKLRSDIFEPYFTWNKEMVVLVWLFDTTTQLYSIEPLSHLLKLIEDGKFVKDTFRSDGKPCYVFEKIDFEWSTV